MENEQIENYATGFSHASILATHAPEVLADIEPDNNLQDNYFEGFFDGKHYYQEQEQNKELEDISALRQSHTKENEHER